MTTAILFPLLFALVTAYPTGAPEGACELPIPQHGLPNQPIFGSDIPYNLRVEQTSSTSVKVTLSTKRGGHDHWKGLFLQLKGSDQPVGEITSFRAADYQLRCSRNAITHRLSSEKTFAEFEWTGIRNRGTRSLTLTATIVYTKQIFYVTFVDIVLGDRGNDGPVRRSTTEEPTTTSTTTTPTTTSTTTPTTTSTTTTTPTTTSTTASTTSTTTPTTTSTTTSTTTPTTTSTTATTPTTTSTKIPTISTTTTSTTTPIITSTTTPTTTSTIPTTSTTRTSTKTPTTTSTTTPTTTSTTTTEEPKITARRRTRRPTPEEPATPTLCIPTGNPMGWRVYLDLIQRYGSKWYRYADDTIQFNC